MNQFAVTQFRQTAPARSISFFGRTFRVIPAVLVRSQVLNNNLGVTLLPATAITDEWAAQWNGVPVLIGPHPTDRGQAVSGRTPTIMNERGAGWIYNARAEQAGTARRLAADVYLDEARVSDVTGLQAVLDRIAGGQPVELSTGFPAHVEQVAGNFEGTEYAAVMHPRGADHLVIDVNMTGACNVFDGCGLGVNEHKEESMSAHERSTLERIFDRAKELFGKQEPVAGDKQVAWEEHTAANMAKLGAALNTVPPSDQDRANLLREALQRQFGSADRTVVVTDVFSDTKQVVFFCSTPFGPDPKGAEYYRATFAQDGEGGAYTFDNVDPERVRRMTAYEPAAQNAHVANSAVKPCGCQEGTTMQSDQEKKAFKDELMAGFSASIAEALKPFSDKIDGVTAAATKAATDAVNAAVAKIDQTIAGLSTRVDAAAAKADAAVVAANAEREAERKALVEELSTNEKTKSVYSAADLEAKPLDELRRIAALAKVEVASFSGRGGPRPVVNAAPESGYLEPVPYFTPKKKGGE